MDEDQKDGLENPVVNPGSVINPGSTPPAQPPAPQPLTTQPTQSIQVAQDTLSQAPAAVAEPQARIQEQPVASDEDEETPTSVRWVASEFIAHEKSIGWYMGLMGAAIVAAALAYIVTRGIVSPAVVIVCFVIMGIYAGHKPRQLEYQLDERGLTMQGKFFSYDDFKSFSIIREAGITSVNFMPLKRFAPILTVYFSQDHSEKINEILLGQLPYEEPRRDAVDSLMRRIRF